MFFASVYFFGEAEGDAAGEDVAASPFFDFFAAGVADALVPPTFTLRHSSEPSDCFQYEPLTSSFSVMSFMLAVFPPLVIEVLSVTLKTGDCFLPAIANVFAL